RYPLTATAHLSTLSLLDALPISSACRRNRLTIHMVLHVSTSKNARYIRRRTIRLGNQVTCLIHIQNPFEQLCIGFVSDSNKKTRSEEHTSELQSRENLVCRLLRE